ncbi:MAG: phosphatidylserine decarboxylase [Pseudomonadota bacterium]
MNEPFDPKRFAWARSKFDIEGIAGAVAAWVVGILLGIVWSPLFWIGAAVSILILLATRRSNRAQPSDETAIVAPVDGVVVAVETADLPSELRYPETSAARIRIASSPASQNRVFAPSAGTVSSVILESGTESQPVAMEADAHGLFNGYITLEGTSGAVGLRLVTGGLGPRVDIDVRDGDTVAAGAVIGKRRLGGWCDVYLPGSTTVAVGPGTTLVGAETRLTATDGTAGASPVRERVQEAANDAATPLTPSPAAPPPGSDTDTETPPAGTAAATEPEPEADLETLTAEDGADPSELFAKLRSRVEEANKPDPDTSN